MRYAVKVAYDGSLFHGSQRQGDDDRGSVEGAVGWALREMRLVPQTPGWPVEFASRTDAGVSALGNVFTLMTDRDIGAVLSALNGNLDGIWCWGAGRMRERQNIRWASSRWYRYHFRPGEVGRDQAKALEGALSLFMGEHDLTHFCRFEGDKDPNVRIEKASLIDLTGSGDMMAADIVGDHFLWQQVRRMVGAALSVSCGEIDRPTFEELLKGALASPNAVSLKGRVRALPPTGLVLMDVNYKDVDFAVEPKALSLAVERTVDKAWESSMKLFLHSALRSMVPR